jgi:hypothetical protein
MKRWWLLGFVAASVGCSAKVSGAGGDGGGNDAGNSGGTPDGGSGGDGGPSIDGGGGGGPDGGNPADSGTSGGSQSVLQRGNDVYRRGNFTQPALTVAAAATMAPDTAFNAAARFSGNVNASLLYLEAGPANAGCPPAASGCTATGRAAGNGIFVVSANKDVYAIDETSGLTVWDTHFPVTGDGVLGTPVIDAASRTLVVAVGASGHHEVHALSVDDGSERTGWPVMLSLTTLSYGGTQFNSVDENQRGALLLLNGIVYVPFGGHYGDGGTYHGWVVAIRLSNPNQFAGWATAGLKEGIWGHGGLASDGTSVFAATGNGNAAAHDSSTDSEEVVRITGMAGFNRVATDVYFPSYWSKMDGSDLDYGASTPAYAPLPPGSQPAGILVAPSKAGQVYFLDASNLSRGTYPAQGGEMVDLTVASITAESVYTSPTIYTSASGIHAAINVGVAAAGCPGGLTGNKMIISMLIQPGVTPVAKEVWCSKVNLDTSGDGHHNAPPISTTTDGVSANALVWFLNGTTAGVQLTAVDGDTGVPVLAATSGAACPGVQNMNFPIAVKGRIVVAANGRLCSWSPGGTL